VKRRLELARLAGKWCSGGFTPPIRTGDIGPVARQTRLYEGSDAFFSNLID